MSVRIAIETGDVGIEDRVGQGGGVFICPEVWGNECGDGWIGIERL